MRHPDDPKQPSTFKFEIVCKFTGPPPLSLSLSLSPPLLPPSLSVCMSLCVQMVCQHSHQESQCSGCLCRMLVFLKREICVFSLFCSDVCMCIILFTNTHTDTHAHPCHSVAGSAGQVITGNHETYLISADSAESADGWVAAIRRVMHEVSQHTYT